jgi:hypothetical protein
MIPEFTKQCIDDYVQKGVPLGDFLTAVMANDLMESFGRADYNNTQYMRDIVAYVYNNTPYNCHGSYGIVEEWIARKKKEREHVENNI